MQIQQTFEEILEIHQSTDVLVQTAKRISDGTPVILKRTTGGNYPVTRDRLRHERDLLDRFDSPQIVQAIDFIEAPGETILVLSHDPSFTTLRQRLRSGPLDIAAGLRLAIGLSRAIGQVHAHGVIHKDINPSNILVNDDCSKVILIDFGISSERSSLNRVGDHLEGTLAYIAPEQTGRMNRTVDYRSDYYSLGATLYEAFTQSPPFEAADAMALVHAHIAQQPAPPTDRSPQIPEMVSQIIVKLLSKASEDRYQSSFGLRADLQTCLDAWAADETIARFGLGASDRSEQFALPTVLFGRQAGLDQLSSAVAEAGAGQTRWVSVVGASGLGKTALFDAFQRQAQGSGLVVSGRFESGQQNNPYQAMFSAIRSAIRQAMTAAAPVQARYRDAAQSAVGDDGQVLVALLPEVEWFLGPQKPVVELGPQDARLRFVRTLLRFLTAFGQPGQPLVVLLDDVQWADSATMDLLRELHTTSAHPIAVVLAARADEIAEGSPIAEAFQAITADATPISLAPLSIAEVQALVEATLGQPDHVGALAELTHDRAQGNPLFVSHLLNGFYREGAIRIDIETGRWTVDMAAAAAVNSSEDVVELLLKRFHALPADHQLVLGRAACIGNRFDTALLSAIVPQPPDEVRTILWNAVGEGFLSEEDEAHCRFVHDQLAQAAKRPLSEQQAEIHLQIARQLWSAKGDEAFLEITRHANQSLTLITEETERRRFHDLNRQAAKRARSAAAFDAALLCLEAAAQLLGESPFETEPERAFQTLFEQFDALFVVGRLQEAAAGFDELQARARSRLEKIRVYTRRTLCRIQQGQVNEALDVSMKAVQLFGLDDLYRMPPEDAVGAKMGAVMGRIMTSDMVAMTAQPPPEEEIAELSRLLGVCVPSAYLVGDGNLYVMLTLALAELALDHGPTPAAAYGLSALGIVMVASAKQYATAENFVQLGYQILEHQPDSTFRIQVDAAYLVAIYHWNHPLRDGLQKLKASFDRGYQAGEIVFSGYCLSSLSTHALLSSASLDALVEDASFAVDFFEQTSNEMWARQVKGTQRLAQSLKDPTRPRTVAGEDFADEAAYLDGMSATNAFIYHVSMMMVSLMDRDYTAAAAHIAPIVPLLPGAAGLSGMGFYAPMAGLIQSHLDHPDADAALKSGLAVAQDWANSVPANGAHLVALLESEQARRAGDDALALEKLDDAIDAAAKASYHNFHGLACEMAAENLHRRGRTTRARGYLEEARTAYQRWGARRLIARLEATWPEHFRHTRRSTTTPHTAGATMMTGGAKNLDLVSILKASRVLSSEVVVDKLLQQLLELVIENAGADQVSLIRFEDGRAWWMASAHHEHSAVEVQLASAETPAQPDHAPLQLVAYVQRTRQSVVIGDITADAEFGGDAFFAQTPSRAVMGLPLIRHGHVTGVMFLGNSLCADAFTKQQISMLDMLASQMAISIENALLYSNLGEMVERKTRALTERERSMQLVLDSMQDGLLECSLDGQLTPIRSRTVEDWFGAPTEGVAVWDYLCEDPNTADLFSLGFEEMASDFMPFDVTAAQMIQRIARGGVIYGLSYTQVFIEGDFERIVISIRDMTDEISRQQAEQRQRELPNIVSALIRDRASFRSFLDEVNSLFERLETNAASVQDLALAQRHLHTLKGNTAIFGFQAFSQQVHHLETLLSEAPEAFGAEMVETLASQWRDHCAPIEGMLKGGSDDQISLRREEITAFQDFIETHPPHHQIAEAVSRWELTPMHQVLDKLARQSQRLATQAQKTIEVVVEDNGVRISDTRFQAFFSSLIHVVRNAIDHGIEFQDDREAAGKAENGVLTFRSVVVNGDLVVEISDDGRGIDWEKVRQKATRNRIPAQTPDDLKAALFHEGLSTREEVTELSGRGIGMAAVQLACVEQGGVIEIDSVLGKGTTTRFRIPLNRSGAQAA
ncbi:MAG: AAA family ATPase [Myxococcota bacterium]